MNYSITVEADASPVLAHLTELKNSLSELTPEIINRIVNSLQSPSEIVCLNLNRLVTSGANNIRVRFEPSTILLELVTAARTGKRQFGLIE